MRVKHRETGWVSEYEPWDGIFTMIDRFWASCPICGGGLTYPIKGPAMAHKECLASVKEEDYISIYK
jgi:hypothetical protein